MAGEDALRLALPSKGEMEGPTLEFLAGCGLAVERPSARGYTGAIPALPGVAVLFQRAADIPDKVAEGSADLGIAGLDMVYESFREDGDTLVIMEDLGFSRCDLVVAVPDPWIDIATMADLADLALEMRERGRTLRVATRYPRLVQRFFLSRGLNHFNLVEASGALEAAPTMGYADIIADLTASGATLRDNHLKALADGAILTSQACLMGNRRRLRESRAKMKLAQHLLEFIEARMRAASYYSITANIKGESPEAVAACLCRRPELAGLQGPTIAPVYTENSLQGAWYAITIVVPTQRLLEAVAHLRQIGGSGIAVSIPRYVFEAECQNSRRLAEALRGRPQPPAIPLW